MRVYTSLSGDAITPKTREYQSMSIHFDVDLNWTFQPHFTSLIRYDANSLDQQQFENQQWSTDLPIHAAPEARLKYWIKLFACCEVRTCVTCGVAFSIFRVSAFSGVWSTAQQDSRHFPRPRRKRWRVSATLLLLDLGPPSYETLSIYKAP